MLQWKKLQAMWLDACKPRNRSSNSGSLSLTPLNPYFYKNRSRLRGVAPAYLALAISQLIGRIAPSM